MFKLFFFQEKKRLQFDNDLFGILLFLTFHIVALRHFNIYSKDSNFYYSIKKNQMSIMPMAFGKSKTNHYYQILESKSSVPRTFPSPLFLLHSILYR